MSTTTISQSTSTSPAKVFKYSFTVVNFENEANIEESVAAFSGKPTLTDWINWLANWYEIGCKLQSPPQLLSIS